MKYFKPIVLTLLLLPAGAFAQKREILDLSRDVANLQDQVRTLQRTLDEKLAVLQTQSQQTLESVSKNNTAVAVLESGIRDRMSEQMGKLASPVAGLSSKVDQMSSDFQALRESVTDLTQRMGKIQSQITDLANTMKVLQAPPSAPQPTGAAGSPAGGPPPAGMSSKDLYDTAQRDRSSGNFDLAMQGFDQYLKFYSDTPLAPNAQFYIGQIYYDKGDFPSAIRAFDLVLERYPENNKTPDAIYMKGMALWKSGQATAAGRQFLDVIQKYPKSDVAPKARDARKALGLNVPSAQAAPTTHRKRR
jgi:tol-pal system protein YbgF